MTSTSSPARRRPLLAALVLLVLVVLAVVAAVVVYQVRQHRRPPSFHATRAGELRLTIPDAGRYSGNVAPAQAGGVGLYLLSVSGSDATVRVVGSAAGADGSTVSLRPGSAVRVAGVTLRLVRAYDLPNDAHDAADVVVTGS